MNLPELESAKISGKKVLVRLDLDISEGGETRLKSSVSTLNFLAENKAKTIIIGHKGRPGEVVSQSLSLSETAEKLGELLNKKIKFVYDIVGAEAKEESDKLQMGEFMMLENLRFDSREEVGDEEFARELASLADYYVNEAFAVSHREHASIVALPLQFKSKSKNSVAAGFRFVKEVENLSKVLENPQKPTLAIISGIKEDKIQMAKDLAKTFDKVLVGGRLPEYFGDEALESVKLKAKSEKLLVGNLTQDKEDITVNTIDVFKGEIKKAGTIVLAGVLGKYEDAGHLHGTKEIFEAVANSSAFKVAGGGDTEAAISLLELRNKFDWISVGGGAMLEFLAKGTLPGIEALLK